MNQKECGNNLPWPSFRYYTMFCVDEMRDDIKSLGQQIVGQFVYLVPP